MNVYRIKWNKGVPFVESGKIVSSGKNKKIRRIKFPSENKTVWLQEGSDTITGAIEQDILTTAVLFGRPSPFSPINHKQKPWLMAACIVRILRLYRRLEKHGLVPHGTYEY